MAGRPDEPSLAAEFHVALPTNEMARLFASCDFFLGPSRSEEGFGLPAAEAMASGLPSVLSEIPSFLSWDDVHDYAAFAADGDGVALGERLAKLIADPELAERLARRGRAVVEQFRAERTAQRLEQWFEERLRAESLPRHPERRVGGCEGAKGSQTTKHMARATFSYFEILSLHTRPPHLAQDDGGISA